MPLQRPNPKAMARLDALMQTPTGRKVGVLGLGVVGRAMAKLLVARGALVVGADTDAGADARADVAALRDAGVELRLGPMDAGTFADVEALAISPGAHPQQEAVTACVERAVPVFGELALVGALPAARTVAITGTNGKSTTTELVGAIAQATGSTAFVGGNLGDPIATWVTAAGRLDDTVGAVAAPVDVAVLELSSFQLESAWRFSCDVAIVLNVTPDHGDRYASIDEYARTKSDLLLSLGTRGVAILNRDDERVAAMADRATGPVWWISTQGPVDGDGAYLSNGKMVPCGSLATLGEIDLTHDRLLGEHNKQNALAAILAVHALGLGNADVYRDAYRVFPGLEHRLEWVSEVDDVLFVNDSKATNDDSAATALRAMKRPVVLLLGGRDKGGGYAEVGKTIAAGDAVRRVIAFGEASATIEANLGNVCEVLTCASLREAVDLGRQEAPAGGVVLLAPACSSFDAFRNYAERGRAFKRMVAEFQGAESQAEELPAADSPAADSQRGTP